LSFLSSFHFILSLCLKHLVSLDRTFSCLSDWPSEKLQVHFRISCFRISRFWIDTFGLHRRLNCPIAFVTSSYVLMWFPALDVDINNTILSLFIFTRDRRGKKFNNMTTCDRAFSFNLRFFWCLC
jgi:hypothetical protein